MVWNLVSNLGCSCSSVGVKEVTQAFQNHGRTRFPKSLSCFQPKGTTLGYLGEGRLGISALLSPGMSKAPLHFSQKTNPATRAPTAPALMPRADLLWNSPDSPTLNFFWKVPCSWQRGWNWVIFKVPSDPNHSRMLQLCDSRILWNLRVFYWKNGKSLIPWAQPIHQGVPWLNGWSRNNAQDFNLLSCVIPRKPGISVPPPFGRFELEVVNLYHFLQFFDVGAS